MIILMMQYQSIELVFTNMNERQFIPYQLEIF